MEFLGSGAYYSVNYERMIPVRQDYMAFRLGGTEAHKEDDNRRRYNMLGGVSYLPGDGPHFFSISITATFTLHKEYPGWLSISPSYRYFGQRGFLVQLSPIYTLNMGDEDNFGHFHPWGGLSVGYGFKDP